MTEFKKHGKTSSHRSNSDRTSKRHDRDRCTLKRVVRRMHRTTAELNQHPNSPVSTTILHREPNKSEYHGRSAIMKPLLSTINIMKNSKWCRDHKGWSADRWKQVIFSDESNFYLFPTAGRVCVYRLLREAYNHDYLLAVKHRGGSGMVWAAIS